MIRFLFLLPLIMCFVWWLYLYGKGYSWKDGIKVFKQILIFNTVIISFFILMIYVTD